MPGVCYADFLDPVTSCNILVRPDWSGQVRINQVGCGQVWLSPPTNSSDQFGPFIALIVSLNVNKTLKLFVFSET